MKPDYFVHDEIYIDIKKAGWQGWGGDKRLAQPELINRLFDCNLTLTKGKLLELGCGEGHHCRALEAYGYDVTGVDISPTAIGWAQEKAEAIGSKGNYLVADLSNPNLSLPNQYQTIIDGNCLHCIIGKDRSVFLRNVHSFLADNGLFFVSSLCAKGSEGRVTNRNGLPYRSIKTENEIILELQEVGFEIHKYEIHQREEHNHITIHALKTV